MSNTIFGNFMIILLAHQAPIESSINVQESLETQEEIIVIGEKLSKWRGKTMNRGGVRTCRTIRSTKNHEIDAIGCNAMLACMTSLEPKAKSLTVSAKSKKEAATLLKPYYSKLGLCVRKESYRQIAALAKSRK